MNDDNSYTVSVPDIYFGM